MEDEQPFPQRCDTSYLHSLPRERRISVDFAHETYSLRTDDINGARARNAAHKSFKYPTPDIEGSSPKRLHPESTNRPVYNLTNADIEGSMPKQKVFRTGRCVNPLNPKYKLPESKPVPPVIPPLLRETNELRDIDGTRPKPALPISQTRDTMNYAVPGSTPKPRQRLRNTPLDSLDVHDIVSTEFKTTRVQNPLSPRYTYDVPAGTDIKEWQIGAIEGCHPRPLPAAHNGPYYPLLTADITHVEQQHENTGNFVRTQYRNTNFIGDIPGATSKGNRKLLTIRKTPQRLAEDINRQSDINEVRALR
mmetsp:Transcript_8559/g.13975  ORF Transcript_8559/g.13975 Transcript_8559/m.13975 type:complete len:306 (+) Transcript_8559:80-997(+)|eukprot:CAMPEP_0184665270 /NCGR_PEP_ID=MMETSP0308-20130426/56449_1 /TAXON_ID=38269 /ORGANISM="Gloeochaete witrockiana, Strain SAG 46.84" /LENGTH=305 /DNA_ID=CAMNT_0027109161 /DNA_START=82 /DNA_END=999 /DNA_ORIENTATION=-